MATQLEMSGIDTNLSAAANRFVDALEEKQEINEKINDRAKELMDAMKAASKGSIRHRGRTLTIEEVEASVKIKVTKMQDAKKAGR